MPFIADTFYRDAKPKTPQIEVKPSNALGEWYVSCGSLPELIRIIKVQGWIYNTHVSGEIRIPWLDRKGAEKCAAVIREALANG